MGNQSEHRRLSGAPGIIKPSPAMFASIGGTYFLLATLTLGWNGGGSGVSPAYLPAGFAFIVVLLLGRRYCLAVLAGVLAVNLFTAAPLVPDEKRWSGLLIEVLGSTVTSAFEPFLAVTVMRRALGTALLPSRPREIMMLVGAASIACLLSGLCGALMLAKLADEYQVLTQMVFSWAVGDLLGILIATLVLYAFWHCGPFRKPSLKVATVFCMTGMSLAVFCYPLADIGCVAILTTVFGTIVFLAFATGKSNWVCLNTAVVVFVSAAPLKEIAATNGGLGLVLTLGSVSCAACVLIAAGRSEKSKDVSVKHAPTRSQQSTLAASVRALAVSLMVSLAIWFLLNDYAGHNKRVQVREVTELSRLSLSRSLEELKRIELLFARRFTRRWSLRPEDQTSDGWNTFAQSICAQYPVIAGVRFENTKGNKWSYQHRQPDNSIPSTTDIIWQDLHRGESICTVDADLLLSESLRKAFSSHFSIAITGPLLPQGWKCNEDPEFRMLRWMDKVSFPFFGEEHFLEVTPTTAQSLKSDYLSAQLLGSFLLGCSILIAALRFKSELAKRAARKAVKALTARDEFLAVISHEMRTPLVSIMGSAEALQEGIHGPVSDAQRVPLNRIQTASEHYLGLVDDILVATSINSGYSSLNLAPVAAADLCKEVVDIVRPSLFTKRQKLHEIGTDSRAVNQIDAAKVQRIIINLLNNASKFSPEGESIDFHFSCENSVWEFRVRDRGPGIPKDQIEKVFQPFEQQKSGLARPQEGVGLGLSIARGLAEMHDGSLSLAPNREGCEFVLVLPMVEDAQNVEKDTFAVTAEYEI